MNLTHKIALDATFKQRAYFARAAGTHRFVFNWALARWNELYASGQRPTASNLKLEFNQLYKDKFFWIEEMHRDCHSQPFADLQRAWQNFFAGIADKPKFKSKHKSRPSFYIANDKLKLRDKHIRIPKIGWVRMRERLRFEGKILSARVVEECGRWFVCIAVDAANVELQRTSDETVGVDLGITTLATLSTGEKIDNPRPLKNAQEQLRRANRKLSRRAKGSRNRLKQRRRLARIHRRIRNIRHDNLHKFALKLCRENQAVVIENLNPSGMMKNHKLAQAIGDASFWKLREILTNKAKRYGTRIVVADRFFPSSKTCSVCGHVKENLSLSERVFQCQCGFRLDRDWNAALNLRQLAVANSEVTPAETPTGVGEAGTIPCSLVNTQ